MHTQSIIDLYKELGIAADLLLLLFVVLFIFGCVIQCRKLEQSWRKVFLITAFLPMVAGLGLFGYQTIDWIFAAAQGIAGLGYLSEFPGWLMESLHIISFAAWLTILLLVFAAILSITGKDKEPVEPEEADGRN